MKKFYSKIVFLVLLTNVYGCDVNSADRKKPEPKPENSTGIPINASGFEIKDSGVRAAGRPVWIDNERVIYLGIDKTKFRMQPDGTTNNKLPKQLLYIWDTKNNTIKPYDEEIGDEVGNVCFFKGFIRYFGVTYQKQSDGKVKKVVKKKVGQIGKEDLKIEESIVGEEPKEDKSKPRRLFNNFSCKESTLSPRDLPGTPLLEGHGYFVNKGRDKPAMYLPGNAKEPLPLPMDQQQIQDKIYTEFNNTYLLTGPSFKGNYQTVGVWPKGEPKPVWILSLDGKAKEIQIPYGDWITNGVSPAYQAKPGILLNAGGGRNERDPGPSGIYLFSNNRVEKIITGLIGNLVVSPDGCNVAFEHKRYSAAAWESEGRDSNQLLKHSLKMINFCNKGQ